MILNDEITAVLRLIEEHLETIKYCTIVIAAVIVWNTLMKFKTKPQNNKQDEKEN